MSASAFALGGSVQYVVTLDVANITSPIELLQKQHSFRFIRTADGGVPVTAILSPFSLYPSGSLIEFKNDTYDDLVSIQAESVNLGLFLLSPNSYLRIRKGASGFEIDSFYAPSPLQITETKFPSISFLVWTDNATSAEGSGVFLPSLSHDSDFVFSTHQICIRDSGGQFLNVRPESSIPLTKVFVNGGTPVPAPTSIVGDFLRVAICYLGSAEGINLTYSKPEGLRPRLETPEQMFKRIEGRPLGFLDLQWDGNAWVSEGQSAIYNHSYGSNPSPTIYNVPKAAIAPRVDLSENYIKNPTSESGLQFVRGDFVSLFVSRTTINPLRGYSSFLVSTGATAPNAATYAYFEMYPLNLNDTGRPLQISFDYKDLSVLQSVGDFKISILCKNNNTEIPVSNPLVGIFAGTHYAEFIPFQGLVDYQLIFKSVVTNKQLMVDDVKISYNRSIVTQTDEPWFPLKISLTGAPPAAGIDVSVGGLGASPNVKIYMKRFNDRIILNGSIVATSAHTGPLKLYLAQGLKRRSNTSLDFGSSFSNKAGSFSDFGVGSSTLDRGGNAYFINESEVGFYHNSPNPSSSIAGVGNTYLNFSFNLDFPSDMQLDQFSRVVNQKSIKIFNSDTTANNNTTAIAYGEDGALVPSGANNPFSSKTIIIPEGVGVEQVVLQVRHPSSKVWINASDVFPHNPANLTGISLGVYSGSTALTNPDVRFHVNGPLSSVSWASLQSAGWRWRVSFNEGMAQGAIALAGPNNSGSISHAAQAIGGPKYWKSLGGNSPVVSWDDDSMDVDVPLNVNAPINGNKGFVPIGALVPYIRGVMTGPDPFLVLVGINPSGFILCNGQTVPAPSPLVGYVTPNLRNSTYLAGVSGSNDAQFLWSNPASNPPVGVIYGPGGTAEPNALNATTSAASSVQWSTGNLSQSLTISFSGTGSFARSDFNSNQNPHTHDLGNHVHSFSHSHSMKHVHLWSEANSNGSLSVGDAGSFDISDANLTSPLTQLLSSSNAVGSGANSHLILGTTAGDKFYTAGVTGENGDETGVETGNTGAASSNFTGGDVALFTGSQSVAYSASSPVAVSIPKSNLHADQTPHQHALDNRPRSLAVLYFMRVL